MNKLFKRRFAVLSIIILSIPTFSQMLRYGIFSMQDFHFFRLVEFDKCVKALEIPCRWAADSGAGFGEPLFNFYGQFVYVIGEIFHLISFSLIDSLKIVFILSLVLSGVSMFFLSRKIWKNDLSAMISSIIYLYAPYRAVDVWVRGALPEAFAFVLFPLIILSIENYLEERKNKDLLLFSLFFGILIITHNLSIILFAPFLIIWMVFKYLKIRDYKPFINLLIAGIFSGFLSAFYLLSVVFESKFIDINSTTTGVYDFRANFVTIYQLFVSRFWGYGGSTWGSGDGLSLSLGQIQWILPLITAFFVLLKRKINEDTRIFLVLATIGLFGLFLTHNKSTFIWISLPFMKYIQFPWRFLSLSVFSLSLAAGLIIKLVNRNAVKIAVLGIIIFFAILVNFNFFKPDIWYSLNDRDLTSGPRWDEARFSSIGDYWPNFGHEIPNKISDGTHINYFPGWNYLPDKNGLISANGAKFDNTPIRTLGNLISLGSIVIWLKFLISNI